MEALNTSDLYMTNRYATSTVKVGDIVGDSGVKNWCKILVGFSILPIESPDSK